MATAKPKIVGAANRAGATVSIDAGMLPKGFRDLPGATRTVTREGRRAHVKVTATVRDNLDSITAREIALCAAVIAARPGNPYSGGAATWRIGWGLIADVRKADHAEFRASLPRGARNWGKAPR